MEILLSIISIVVSTIIGIWQIIIDLRKDDKSVPKTTANKRKTETTVTKKDRNEVEVMYECKSAN